MTRRVWQSGLWLLLGAVFLLTAYLIINTTFMIYDDEGYVLLTYRNFNAGKHLYDEIFSQYGPWPYVYHLIIGLGLGAPLTHMAGRDLTALHWACCSLAVGLTVGLTTRKTVSAIFCSLATFGVLWQMGAEPSHPGSLISAMLALTALASVLCYQRSNWTGLGATTGIMAALLVLTKINVGIFLITGAGVAALRFSDWRESWRRPANLVAGAGLLLLPWGLMAKKLGDPSICTFAIQFTGAAAGLLWVTPSRTLNRSVAPRTWTIATAAFIAALLAVSFTVCLRGTSLSTLIHAVLLEPLRHPASFMVTLHWPVYIWPAALLGWAIAFRAGWELRRHETISPATRNIIIAARLLAALGFLIHAETWLTITGTKGLLISCLPLLPVFLVPLASPLDHPGKLFEANLWLACLALPQTLHAYPVAGTQMGWGSFLMIPVLVAGLFDATLCLRFALPGLGRRLFRFTWSLLLLTGVVQVGLLFYTGWTRYHDSRPLNLPGAEDVRAGDRAMQVLRVLTLNASLHADVLFSQPGMFSFNIWSNVPTPTDKNATHWFWLSSVPEQQQIIGRLQQVSRSAIIVSHGTDEFLTRINVTLNGVLRDYIADNYRPLFTVEDMHMQFLVPSTSTAVPFGQWELLVPVGAAQKDESPFLLRTNIVLAGQPVSVRLRNISSPWSILKEFSPEHARIVLEPIDSRGNLSGPSVKFPPGQPVKGLFRLSVYLAQDPQLAHPSEAVLEVVDATGEVLSESIN